MEGEEIQEVIQKPESMLSPKVQQILIEVVDRETEKALKDGDHAYAMELQRAKKLVERGCWSVRKANPYLDFVSDCVAESKPNEKLNLTQTQELLRGCSLKWKDLPLEKRREYEARAKGLAVYDYL